MILYVILSSCAFLEPPSPLSSTGSSSPSYISSPSHSSSPPHSGNSLMDTEPPIDRKFLRKKKTLTERRERNKLLRKDIEKSLNKSQPDLSVNKDKDEIGNKMISIENKLRNIEMKLDMLMSIFNFKQGQLHINSSDVESD